MRGCTLGWSTVQLPLLLALISVTAFTRTDVNNVIFNYCEFQSSENTSSKCYTVHSTDVSPLCMNDEWVSTEAWLENCSLLLKQNISSGSGQVLAAPTLHCKDDNAISVTWSKNPDNFDPLDNDSYIFVLETQRKNGTWETVTVTRRPIGVARNLEPDTYYRFRVEKIGAHFRQQSPEGNWIRTFRRWSSKEGTDQTCWYNVVIDDARHDEVLKSVPVYTAEAPMAKVINDLKIGVNYSVKVIGLERNHSHSGFRTIDHIPSCEVFPVNLNLTGPTAPNIGVTHNITEENDDRYRIDVNVHWTPLPGGPPCNVTIVIKSDLETQSKVPVVVDGKKLNVTVKNVTVRHGYAVEVFATSPGGEGKHTKSDFIEVQSPPRARVTSVGSITLVGIPLLCAVFFILKIYQKPPELTRGSNCMNVSQTNQHTELPVKYYDDWEIPRENLVIGHEIGRGAFGTVHQALLSQPNGLFEVAVKKLRSDPTLDDMKQFKLEMEIMKGVDKHPNVVSLVGCVTKLDLSLPADQLLVVEYCVLGDLQSFLRKASQQIVLRASTSSSIENGVKYADIRVHTDSSCGSSCNHDDGDLMDNSFESQLMAVSNHTYGIYLGMKGGIPCSGVTKRLASDFAVTPTDLLSFARQVTIGMDFLSSNRVVHRDLAARNVLVCADRTVKISDFGLSRDIYEQNVYKKIGAERIPVKWLAIESLMHQIYTTQSDVWSFGILLWEIVTLGGSPYPSVSNDSLFRLLSSGYRMERPSTCGIELYKIMCDCWQTNPMDRPNFHTLQRRLDELLEAATPHEYIHIDQLFAVNTKENVAL